MQAGLFNTNRNGMFERAEYTAFGDNNLVLWDSNNYLDSYEFFGDDEFGVWDRNRDGLLDTDEWGF